ncbi:unnamed protein product [Schistosoma margrebowiei]|uniref:Uncharacterized protein n=1 Tax=Schistosoma margrebowiei TaxID=48269 RepID=A0A183N1D0_9TREM|nr:unnamed protein product [Schistosoma margrebowiei]
MNIVQRYAPTNDYNEDAKDQFYNRLQSIVEKCPTKDLTILMGDLNAEVGMDNTGYEDIMGRHGMGERNENGKHPIASQDKLSHGILKAKGKEEDQRTHYAGKWK